jgi:excisionase family DNA binding protein
MSARLEAALAELAAAIREEVATAAPAAAPGPDRLLSIDEAADVLGIGRSRLYAELAAGQLRSVKIGRRRLVPSSAIAERQADPPKGDA